MDLASAPEEPVWTAPRRRGRGLVIAGAVIAVLALIGVVVCAVQTATVLGGPLKDALTNPVLATPVDTSMKLEAGRYRVFELTGHSSGGNGFEVTSGGPPQLFPQAVTVVGPTGQRVPTSSPGSVTETLTRGHDIYTAAVGFVVSDPGTYRIQVSAGRPTQVVIGPTFGSGFSRVWGWALGVGVSSLLLVFGLILLIVGLVMGRRPKNALARPLLEISSTAVSPAGGSSGIGSSAAGLSAAGSSAAGLPTANPVPGWYADPREAGRLRYWSGTEWTSHTR
jgi:hypothetical protein